MAVKHRIKIFSDRFPLLGPVLWILAIQYFIIQIVVAAAWPTHYSIAKNAISDLGNTVCAAYGDRLVCSPWHALMNASFIMLGVTMIVGAGLLYQEFRENLASFIGFGLQAVAGLGTILVGLFPENTIAALHIAGATGPFVFGNISLLVLGVGLKVPKSLRVYTFVSGLLGLAAVVAFRTSHFLGLGFGGMERVVAYPQTIWLIVFGIYMSRAHYAKVRRH